MSMAAVSVPPKFLNLMVDARDKQETGKLYAYYRDEAIIHIGMLFFDHGKLIGCRFDKQTGLDAVKTLFHTTIGTAMFVRANEKELEQQASMPDVNEVISTLKHERDEAVAPWVLSGQELIQAVSATMADILGEKGRTIVEKVAAGYPPQENAKLFEEECIRNVANFLGLKRAKEIIEPIFS
ncbi:MAG: hypothetical protein OEZ68_14485 [Gammaproteobacteria bacterium]|nr:hypothetical protein [Gammaproteobacteria bacterium]MDH5802010.1 hypothetical protein [Gammaproteobacteria bacterium]